MEVFLRSIYWKYLREVRGSISMKYLGISRKYFNEVSL